MKNMNIKKNAEGKYVVGGLTFDTLLQAANYADCLPEPLSSKIVTGAGKVGSKIAIASARGGARFIGWGLRGLGNALATAGEAVKVGLDETKKGRK